MPFDSHWESEGIILEEEYFCFNCRQAMKKISKGKWQCQKCGISYDEESI